MRGKRSALLATFVFGVIAACGRQLPPDELGPEGVLPEAGLGSDSGGPATKDATGDDGSSSAPDGTVDASTPDGAVTCTPCLSDGGCCQPGEACLAAVCTPCSGPNKLCDSPSDCCASTPALVCQLGLCCMPAGGSCTALSQSACCSNVCVNGQCK